MNRLYLGCNYERILLINILVLITLEVKENKKDGYKVYRKDSSFKNALNLITQYNTNISII